MDSRTRLEAYLRQNGVPFQIHHHPQAFTAQEVSERDHVPGRMMVKVVIVIADGKNVVLALPAPCRVDLDKAAAAVGAKEARLAREDEFAAAFPDCEVGAMPPFGNLYLLRVFVDPALQEVETIYFQAGTHTDSMSLKYADFARLVNPTVAPFADRA